MAGGGQETGNAGCGFSSEASPECRTCLLDGNPDVISHSRERGRAEKVQGARCTRPPATRSSLYRVLARIRVFYWQNNLSHDPTVGNPRDLELLTGDTEEISSVSLKITTAPDPVKSCNGLLVVENTLSTQVRQTVYAAGCSEKAKAKETSCYLNEP